MSVFDISYQEEIIKLINEGSNVESVIEDIILQHQERATQISNLYKRHKLISSSTWTEGVKEPTRAIDIDGVPIYGRKFDNELKVNQKLHNDFFNRIVNTFVGYFSNAISITADEKRVKNEAEGQLMMDLLNDFYNRNTFNTKLSELSAGATMYGTDYLLLFPEVTDEQESKNVIKCLDLNPWETVLIKSDVTGETEYGLRYWDIEEVDTIFNVDVKSSNQKVNTYRHIEWYDKTTVSIYKQDAVGGTSFKLIETRPHFFPGYVPIVEFPKNKERIGDVERTLDMQDAYDITLSDLSAEVATLRLSYLVGEGVGTALDDEFREQVKQTGILTVDQGGKWYFLEKDLSGTTIFDLLDRMENNIYLFSNSVDFSSKELSANMPIMAFQLKIKPLEESAKITELMFRKSLMEMFEIIFDFHRRNNKTKVDFTNIKMQFTRNLPSNVKEEIENFNLLFGKLSLKTALSRLSFIEDVDEEIERIETMQQGEADLFNEMNKVEDKEDENTQKV